MTIIIKVNEREIIFDDVFKLSIDDKNKLAEFQFSFFGIKFPYLEYENINYTIFIFKIESELGIQQGVVPVPVILVQPVQSNLIQTH
jgi:hypothetical protein